MNCAKWFLMALLLLRAATAHCLEASVNYAVFHKHSPTGIDSAFLEVYWQINPMSLHYHKNAQGELYTEIQIALSVSTDTNLVLRDRYVQPTNPAKPGAAAQQNLLQFHRYYVPSGKVQLQIDLGENEFLKFNFHYSQIINTLDTVSNLHLGPLQLLDTFVIATTPNILQKNGYTQLPRVVNFYDEGQRNLHFYHETYAPQQEGARFVQQFSITKNPGDFPIMRLQVFDTIDKAKAINPALHSFYLGALATGNYYLNATLINAQGVIIDTQSLFFQMINKTPDEVKLTSDDSAAEAKRAVTFLDLTKTFVYKYDIKQILAILKMIRPVADPSEVRTIDAFIRKPDEMYMRYFVYNYFSKDNKAHPEDAWKAFADQIREINREFKGGNKMGYETDRGRIYLQYGKPDERVRVPSEGGAVPYEVWRYDAITKKQNQIGVFLFYQPGFSINDYILLTSTVTGEMNNPAWRSMLYPGEGAVIPIRGQNNI